MAFKFVILAACVAFASAGFLPTTYQAGPAPLAYHAAAPAPLAYHAAAPAPLAYHAAAPAPLAYHAAAPAPLTYHAAAAPSALVYQAPLAKTVVTKQIDADYDPHPQYSYGYDVHDSLTGDIKSQQESRDGDVVHGSYSLVEADGSRRIVDYTADPVNGFNAVVHKEPAQVAVKAVHAAPLVHSAPVAQYSPLAYYHH